MADPGLCGKEIVLESFRNENNTTYINFGTLTKDAEKKTSPQEGWAAATTRRRASGGETRKFSVQGSKLFS